MESARGVKRWLWLFWAAPIVGAVLGAVIYAFIGDSKN